MRIWIAKAGEGPPNAHDSEGNPITITDDGVFKWTYLGEGTVTMAQGDTVIIEHTEKFLD